MDNFVILEKTMEELEERMIRFLKIAEKYNLCFKRSKCNFNMEEIPILEVIVVVATTYHKGQMISLTSKPQKKYDVGIHKRTQQGVSA